MSGLNRRGILGLIASAPMAAPAVASELAGIRGGGIGGVLLQQRAMNYAGEAVASPSTGFADMRDWASDRLKRLTENRSVRVRELMRHTTRLDPDLASSRSLSLSAKIRLQAIRDEQVEFEQESKSLTGQIASYAKAFLGQEPYP